MVSDGPTDFEMSNPYYLFFVQNHKETTSRIFMLFINGQVGGLEVLVYLSHPRASVLEGWELPSQPILRDEKLRFGENLTHK